MLMLNSKRWFCVFPLTPLRTRLTPWAHVLHRVNAGHGDDVGLVVGEVGVGLYGLGHFIEACAVFQLYVDHAAVYALALGHGKREGRP